MSPNAAVRVFGSTRSGPTTSSASAASLSTVRAKGRIKTREALIEDIRDRHYDVFDRSIDVHISALRKKMGDDAKNPRFIRTVRAAGYMLVEPDTP